ncbi:MAG: hypothetical protein PF961_15340 [Planctomycetota bacterium]|jgi:chromosome segregation ATPase|nr:hypothetical protein [Planctomycetota bacterium]
MAKRKRPGATSDLNALLSRTAADRKTLSDVLQQAQLAQDALIQQEEAIALLQQKHDEDYAELEEKYDAVVEDATAKTAEMDAATAAMNQELGAALKTLRALCAAMLTCGDPLEPLSEDDNNRDLVVLRSNLDEQVDRRGSVPKDLPGADAALAAARDLFDCIAARCKVQSNRVKLLQDTLEELEADNAGLHEEAEALRNANDAAQETIDATLADMDVVAAQIATLHEDLVNAESTIEAKDAEAAETAERQAGEVAELQDQISASDTRIADLATQLKETKELAHKAEHAGAELAEAVVALADGEIRQGAPVDLVSLQSARDELQSLANDAGEDWDDEVDELFRDDLGEELVSATKTMVEVVLKRRQSLLDALNSEATRAAELDALCTSQSSEIADLSDKLANTEQELSRTQAQLETTQDELEQLSTELASKHKELTEKSGSLAKSLSEIETLRDQAQVAKTLKTELNRTQGDLGRYVKRAETATQMRTDVSKAQNQLGQALVELATATDVALTAGQLKSTGGNVSRFTKSFRKLDDAVQHSDGDLLRLIRNSADVVEKVTNRVEHISSELQTRGATISDNESHLVELERLQVQATESLDAQELALKELKLQHQELARLTKHSAKLEDRLGKKEALYAQASEELKALKDEHRTVLAELEELRAREEELSESSTQELADMKRRLGDEQSARRATESDLSDEREELQTQITVLEARYAELETSLDDRDRQIADLQNELDEAADLKALLKEAQSHVKQLAKDLQDERSRIQDLQEQVAGSAEAESLAEELKEAAAERDQLMAKIRASEKRHADDAGNLASLRSNNESLSRKLDDLKLKSREELQTLQERCDALFTENKKFKEKNVGLNARVRSLTNH